MTDDIDDGSTKPLGHTSDDACLEVRQNERGEKEYVETELGQHDRWMRLAPDLFEKYMALVEEVAILRTAPLPAAPAPAERTCATCLNHMKERPVIDSHLRRVEYVERHGERNVSCRYDALPKAGCFYLGRDIPDEVFGGPFHCALWESHYAEKPAEVNQIVSALGSHGENGDIAGVRQGPIVATPAEHSAVAGVGFQEPTVAAPRHPPQRPHDAV